MERRPQDIDDDLGDEVYFEPQQKDQVFDTKLLHESLRVLGGRQPPLLSPGGSVTDAVRAMQKGHRGCVLITEDGTADTPLLGIFTERDVLFRIVDRGRNPAVLQVSEVMTPDPERVVVDSSVAWVLNKMSTGGFRHIPIVDAQDLPVAVVSVRDVVDFLVDHFPREILNLPPAPGADTPRTREGA